MLSRLFHAPFARAPFVRTRLDARALVARAHNFRVAPSAWAMAVVIGFAGVWTCASTCGVKQDTKEEQAPAVKQENKWRVRCEGKRVLSTTVCDQDRVVL